MMINFIVFSHLNIFCTECNCYTRLNSCVSATCHVLSHVMYLSLFYTRCLQILNKVAYKFQLSYAFLFLPFKERYHFETWIRYTLACPTMERVRHINPPDCVGKI